MVVRSWRTQTPRTPKGEMLRPRLSSSFETRAWPQAGCSMWQIYRGRISLASASLSSVWRLAGPMPLAAPRSYASRPKLSPQMRETRGSIARRSRTSCRKAASPASVKKARGPLCVVRSRPARAPANPAPPVGFWADRAAHRRARYVGRCRRRCRVLAEVAAQLAPEQVALGRGERGGRTIGSAAH